MITAKIIHTSRINQQTRMNKTNRNAGDVEDSMTLQVVGRNTQVVSSRCQNVKDFHAKNQKKRKGVKEERTKANEKVKLNSEQNRLIRMELIKHVNSVVSIANTGNCVRLITL